MVIDPKNDENVYAWMNGEIGNAVPMTKWNDLEFWISIPHDARPFFINKFIRENTDLFQAVLDGFSEEWDGSNYVGKLTPEAEDALEELNKASEKFYWGEPDYEDWDDEGNLIYGQEPNDEEDEEETCVPNSDPNKYKDAEDIVEDILYEEIDEDAPVDNSPVPSLDDILDTMGDDIANKLERAVELCDEILVNKYLSEGADPSHYESENEYHGGVYTGFIGVAIMAAYDIVKKGGFFADRSMANIVRMLRDSGCPVEKVTDPDIREVLEDGAPLTLAAVDSL